MVLGATRREGYAAPSRSRARWRSRNRFLSALAVALLGFPGCSDPNPQVGPRNVLLISIDTLRADRLGSYGYDRETSPFLDAFAARGTRFSNAFVNTLATPPSHTTIFSSLYQETHRVSLRETTPRWRRNYIPEQIVLLPERLREAGYYTVGVTEGGWMSGRYGWSRGFDAFDDSVRDVASGAQALIRALAEVGESDRPVFAFLHTYEVHLPYTPPVSYRERFSDYRGDWVADVASLPGIIGSPEGARFLSDMYDAEIRYTDDTLRDLFVELEAIGFLEHAWVVVTADHGEQFGEHGHFSHTGHLYDELVKIPLFFVGEGIPAGVVDDRMVSTVDLVPTLMGCLGLQADTRFAGRDLLCTGRGEGIDADAVFMQFRDQRYAVRTPRWKLIETMKPKRRVELYDLEADPGEKRNLAELEPERVKELSRRLRSWQRSNRPMRAKARSRPAQDLSPQEAARLRELGYLD